MRLDNTDLIVLCKNRWGMTVLSVILCAIASPLLICTLFLPRMLMTVPLLLVFLLGYIGPVSTGIAIILFASISGVIFSAWSAGAWGIVCGLLFCLPVVLSVAITTERKTPFWLSAAIVAAVGFISCCLIVGIIGWRSGTDVVSAMTQMIREQISQMTDLQEMLLYIMNRYGLLVDAMGNEIQQAALSAEQKTQVASQMISMMDSVLRLQIPMQITSGALVCGALGEHALRRGLRKRGADTSYPAFRTWYLPKGWGGVLGITLAALFACNLLLPQYTQGMFYVYWGLFSTVFTLQGIATDCWLVHGQKESVFLQGLVFVLGYGVATMPAMIIGIADQAFDFSHRRSAIEKAPKYNPFDPRNKEQ